MNQGIPEMSTKHRRNREQQVNYRMTVVTQDTYSTADILWSHVSSLSTVRLEIVLEDSHVFTWSVAKLTALRVNGSEDSFRHWTRCYATCCCKFGTVRAEFSLKSRSDNSTTVFRPNWDFRVSHTRSRGSVYSRIHIFIFTTVSEQTAASFGSPNLH